MRIRGSRRSAVLLSLATLAAGQVVALGAAPAQADWTNASGMTRLHVCKEPGPQERGWIFLTRARKRANTEDARAVVQLYVRGEARQRWSSGWLRDREVERGWVRTVRSRRVRVHLEQEAGDRDSGIGTALEHEVLRPRQIDLCS